MAWSAPTEWERWDPEQLLVCPYDEVHKVAAKRFQYHLMKCRKNHPGKDFVPCPFNAKHMMLRPALRHHVAICPDRSVIEQYSFKGSTKDSDGFYFKGDTSLPGYCHQDWELQPSESWDDDGTQTPVSQFQPHRKSQQLPSAEQNPQRDTLSMDSKERRDLKEQLRRQAVQAAHRTGMKKDLQALTVNTAVQSSPMQPSNNSIYMYGLQQTNQAKHNATVSAPGISQTNRLPLAQAPRPASAGRGVGILAAMVPRTAPGQPAVQSCAVRPPESSPHTAEVLAPSTSQRLPEEIRQSPENSSSQVSAQVVGSTSGCERQSVPQQNFQSSSSVNKAGKDVSARLAYPSGQGVGRARLLAEARKNNFGGICRTGLSNPPFGRGRGVLN